MKAIPTHTQYALRTLADSESAKRIYLDFSGEHFATSVILGISSILETDLLDAHLWLPFDEQHPLRSKLPAHSTEPVLGPNTVAVVPLREGNLQRGSWLLSAHKRTLMRADPDLECNWCLQHTRTALKNVLRSTQS